MSKEIVYFESDSTDPSWNLALEQYIFDKLPKDKEYFLLWQNANTIVVGKHQNTMEEIDAAYVKEHDIKVVRRLSGGGAVYHDLGNINYTFIGDADNLEELNLQAFCMPVLRTLRELGIPAELSGRNDMTIDGKKFSGNAQYIKQGRVMHHGTLMFDSDLEVVEKALCVNKDKYISKGFQSVRSRITNISPYMKEKISVEAFKNLLKEYVLQNRQIQRGQLSLSNLFEIEILKQTRYDQWDWNYGESPQYSVRKERRIGQCGKVILYMIADHGIIREISASGDYFGEGMSGELKERLKNCRLEERVIRERISGCNLQKYFKNMQVDDLVQLMLC